MTCACCRYWLCASTLCLSFSAGLAAQEAVGKATCPDDEISEERLEALEEGRLTHAEELEIVRSLAEGDVLNASNRDLALNALRAVGRRNPTDLRPVTDKLEAALKRARSESEVCQACEAFHTIGYGPESSVAALNGVLNDRNERVFAKPRAAGALIQIKKGHPESLDWLLDRLKSDRPLERATAASALGRLGPYGKPAVAKLLERLEDQDSTVRVLAACSLWQLTLEPSRILPVLQGALGDANAEVKLSPDGVWATHPTQRQLAAFYLGGMGPAARPAVPDLIGVLKDKDRVLRSRALDALGSIQLRTPEVYQALKAQTDDADPKIAAKAAEVLKRLGGE